MPKPTNNTIIFQHVLSSSGCLRWLAQTAPLTLEYCMKWKMDFQLVAADFEGFDGTNGHWAVPRLIRIFMDQGYEKIIYLDADTVIMDPSVDLRDAFKVDKIGAVWHNLSYNVPDWSHFNVGALYVDSTVRVQHFVDLWLAGYPGSKEFPWYEQGVFNILGTEMDIIHKLDNKWNGGHVSPSDHPVVLGLHGIPERIEAIIAAVEKAKSV